MVVGCPFITCAIKKKGIEFCWDCEDNNSCEKWKHHREFSKQYDTFKCYQKLEDNISFIMENGVDEFDRIHKIRNQLLDQMLIEFNEGRSKSYYCIAATVFEIAELRDALDKARQESYGLDVKARSKVLRSVLNTIAGNRNYTLRLRKWVKDK